MTKRDLQMALDEAHKRIKELETALDATSVKERPGLPDIVFDNSPGGMAVVSLEGEIHLINQAGAAMVGLTPKQVQGMKAEALYADFNDKFRLRTLLEQDSPIVNHEVPLRHNDGSTVWASVSIKLIEYEGSQAAFVNFMDISEQKAALQALRLDELRFESLYSLSEMVDEPENAIFDFALETAIKVTSSSIGYISLVNEDETEVTPLVWSRKVMAQCDIQEHPASFKVADIGMLGQAIRQRQTVVTNHNDYDLDELKYPKGHVPIVRHITLPVMEGDRITLLAAVANKKTDYGDEDVRQLHLIMTGMWRLIQRRRAEAELRAAHEKLEMKVHERTRELSEANKDMAILNIRLIKRNEERKKAEAALKKSEERFRSIFENNHAVMFIINPKSGAIADANPAAEHYYGYSHDELTSMKIFDLNTLAPDKTRRHMQRVMESKQSNLFFKHRLANGAVRDVEVFTGTVVVDDEELLCSIIHDITERRRSEETMRRYERIISSSPDLISLVDRNYTYQMVNDTYLRVFDKRREEIVGNPIVDLVGRELFENVAKASLDKAFLGETVTVETVLKRPRRTPMDLSVKFHPVKNLKGVIDLVCITTRDITAMKQSTKALREVAERLDLATSAGRVGIWEWNALKDEMIWDNVMLQIYRVDPSKFNSLSEAWRERVHPDDLERADKLLSEAVIRSRPWESEFRIV